MMAHSRLVLGTLWMLLLGTALADGQAKFDSARPLWPAGREREMNLFVGFKTVFECSREQSPLLRITGSSLYRIYLNGQFVGHGPARGPHGYYRVDEWPLRTSERNTLAIEVAGYNVNSYYLLDQPAFLQAEVVSDGTVLASTAGKGVNFDATILKHRVQKVQRYSFQRPFIGNYLRTELLSRYGYPAQIKKELVDYYLYMADQTGTLWENIGAYASCNHGFASHVAHSLYRDVLGTRQVDPQKKVIRLKVVDVGLDWCEGTLATPDGPVAVKWWKDKDRIVHRVDLPAGYTVRDDSIVE